MRKIRRALGISPVSTCIKRVASASWAFSTCFWSPSALFSIFGVLCLGTAYLQTLGYSLLKDLPTGGGEGEPEAAGSCSGESPGGAAVPVQALTRAMVVHWAPRHSR
jgi:hypothetical protein